MFCGKCGAENLANSTICSSCGEPFETVDQAPVQEPINQQPINQQPAYQQPAYQQPAYQRPAYQQPAYQQPIYQVPVQQTIPEGYSETVSVGEWVGTMLLMCIPIVNFILIFVWAFGNSKKSKANYFKACLLISLISIGVCILLGVLIGIFAGGFYYY